MLEIYKFNCFTTPCEIHLYTNSKIIADSCAKDILKECKRLELKYNYFNSNSYLSKLNSRSENILDSETKSLLSRAKQYYKKTNKIFDITVGTIKNNYENIDSLTPYIGCEFFEIKKDKLIFLNNLTKIDLGGFVKEYSVDKSVSIIKKYKIKSAIVNFGGDIYALGKKPNGEQFKIGITNPLDKEKNLFFVNIEDQALTTSASYERKILINNHYVSHIIPKENINKNIIDCNVLSVTVVSNNCAESGVYSTAIMADNNVKTIYDKYIVNKSLNISRF